MKIIRPLTVTDGMLVSSSVPEDDYGNWSSATTYADGDRVMYIAADVHEVYESLQNANTNHDPTAAASSTWWVKVGATNRWRMFDLAMSSQTAGDTSIVVQILPRDRVDSICLFNTSAWQLRVQMNDPLAGSVFDQTFSLSEGGNVTDWFAYFFEPVTRKTDFVLTSLPIYSDATITLTLTDWTTAKCGALVLGLAREVGDTEYGMAIGIQDYSIKEADQWGEYYITERAYSKRAEMTVWVAGSAVDALQRLLAEYRATPAVYIGADQYGSSAVFGFYKDFAVEIRYPTASVCTISVEGLA